MTLDFTKGRKQSSRPPLSKRQKWFLWCGLTFATVTFYFLSSVTVVINGTTSLPHTGYVMVTWPQIMREGVYVAFDAPDEFAEAFDNLVFVKRVVGLPGDTVEGTETQVCVRQECRQLQAEMIAAGYSALESHVIPDGKVVAFGEASDSLDSRYAAIGSVDARNIVAVGYPIKLPHWKELGSWLGTL